MGLGNIIGGALAGVGQGMAQSGMAAIEERRQMALEALRNQYRTQEIAQQGEEQRKTQESGARLNDWQDARSNERRTASTMTIDKNRSNLDIVKAKVEAGLREANANGDTRRAIALQTALRQMDAGEIKEVVPSSDGNYYGVTKSGQKIPLDITAPQRALYGSGQGDSIWGPGGAAPTGAPTSPVQQPPKSRPPLSQFDR